MLMARCPVKLGTINQLLLTPWVRPCGDQSIQITFDTLQHRKGITKGDRWGISSYQQGLVVQCFSLPVEIYLVLEVHVLFKSISCFGLDIKGDMFCSWTTGVKMSMFTSHYFCG